MVFSAGCDSERTAMQASSHAVSKTGMVVRRRSRIGERVTETNSQRLVDNSYARIGELNPSCPNG
jgi:hypothetical protein